MSEPRRSARNAGKPAPSAPTPAPTKAPVKRKSTASDGDAKKVKPSPAGTLNIGDKLPSLTLKTQAGTEIETDQLKSAILFSYPRANTSGCTTQAKLYRDNHSTFSDLGYTVYGLSNDSPASLGSWKDKQKFFYDLISDPKRELIKALTGSDDKTRRSHFVVDAEGKLSFSELSVKPVESWSSVLAFVKEDKK